MSRSKSEVWQHFLHEDKNARCKRCSAVISRSGNTTNLWTYLRLKHNITKLNAATEKNSVELDEESVDDPDPNATVPQAQPTPSTSSADLRRNDRIAPTKRLKTVSIADAFGRQKSFQEGGEATKAITEAVIFMITKDSLPFNSLEKEGFKHFLQVYAKAAGTPQYKGISRQTVSRMVDAKYDLLFSKVKEDLQGVKYLSLTCDVWTDTQATVSYLGVTVHYLDIISMELVTIMLEVIHLEERHTGINLCNELKAILEKWGIPKEKITSIVTDNGSNIKRAVDLLLGPEKQISCIAHSLNLVILDSLKSVPEIELIRSKIKSIVTYFKRCVPAADALRAAQERNGSQALKLKQEVLTRFYSTFIMIERFVLLKDHVASVLISCGGPDMLTGSEINVIQELLALLKPFQLAITELSAEKNVTVSKVIPLVNCIKKAIENSKASSLPIQNVKAKFLLSLSHRFGEIEHNPLLAMATLIDPRFKRIHFNDINAHASVINKASELVVLHQRQQADDNARQHAENRSRSEKNNELWSHHENLLAMATSNANTPDVLEDVPTELQQFLNQPPSDRKCDPFSVWRGLKDVYPNIFPIAHKFLSVPGSSVPCERLFSKAGRLVSEDRNRLNPKKIGKLCFLQSVDVKYWSKL